MIDPDLIPDNVMIDTSVFISGVGNREDEFSPVCRELIKVLTSPNYPRFKVFFPAVAAAEVMRHGDGGGQIPRWKNFQIVPFDLMAAQVIGRELPWNVIKEQKNHSDLPFTYVKYDALIVASAIRHKVDVLIGLDSDFRKLIKLATGAELKLATPRDYLTKQPKQPKQLKQLKQEDLVFDDS